SSYCLAIAIGVKSGFYRSTPEINFDLLRKIRNNLDVHLSLHGCSGLSEEVIKKCVSSGISFTAWATDIRFAFFEKIDEIRKEKGREYVIPGNILIPARDSMKNEIINKLGQSGSIGKGSEIINFYKNRSKTDIAN
ncbi:MAG: class II fructose-bisphosphate aldolase, partial [Actinobacteria bacterium]|nr:class II fructose-bisphosphate aldolase [Actinomycetota bacterium]